MKSNILVITTSAIFLMATSIVGNAADQDQEQAQEQNQEQMQPQTQKQQQQPQMQASGNETVYGWELMSVKERKAHQAKMKKLKSPKERTAYLEKHHKLMEKRAKERGVTLPEIPMQGGQGAGPGAGAGGGAGNR